MPTAEDGPVVCLLIPIGVTGLIVGQPFDVVKVRYQTPQYIGRYGSTFSALGV